MSDSRGADTTLPFPVDPVSRARAPSTDVVLELRELCVRYRSGRRLIKAVDGVSYGIAAGETVALVGESGCGKSATALAVMGLLPRAVCEVSGSVFFEGEDLLTKSDKEMRRVRGARIAMVFQEPMSSLNPVLTIGRQLMEPLELHLGLKRHEAGSRALELLRTVRIADGERRLGEYPHQLSGGMRQRVMLAMALACEPRVILADEPTTALDVTVQAQVLDLMKEVASDRGIATILITHNLGLVARYADRVNVMYAGRIVESAETVHMFNDPRHPYTSGLLKSVPRIARKGQQLIAIGGAPPDLADLPQGCAFQPRCPIAFGRCTTDSPVLADRDGDGHTSACWAVAEVQK